jgi:DNA-binding transcriptional LysR family regulator
MDNWNDLKLVLAIERAGTLGGGALALAIDHSTAFRRLNGLEERIGTRLFERLPGGVYQPTPAGELFASAAERVETETAALSRAVDGRDTRLAGSLRVTASETLANSMLTPQLAAFHAVHPGIVIELVVDSRVLSLSRREADIALRVVRPKEPDLFGRKLADIAWAIYGAATVMDARPQLRDVADLAAHDFVGCGAEIADISAADWLAEHVAAERIVYRANSMINQLGAAKAGMGLAVLPCFLGDPEPGLARAVPQPIAPLQRELWIVTHSDLKKTARVRAFFDIVGEGLIAQSSLFGGNRGA